MLTVIEKVQIARIVEMTFGSFVGHRYPIRNKKLEKANQRVDITLGIHCWLYCLYADRSAFDASCFMQLQITNLIPGLNSVVIYRGLNFQALTSGLERNFRGRRV